MKCDILIRCVAQRFFGVMVFFVSVVTPQLTLAQDRERWALDFGTQFLSEYYFRGVQRYDGFSVQPALTAAHNFGKAQTLSAGVWAQLPAQGERGPGSFKKIDYSLIYDFRTSPGTISFGHYWYTYTSDHTNSYKDTNELYFGIALDAFLTPTFAMFKDYQRYDTIYYEFSLSEKVESASFGQDISFTPFISSGYVANPGAAYESGGLVQLTYGVYCEQTLGPFVFTPSLNYTRAYDRQTDSGWWGGVSININF